MFPLSPSVNFTEKDFTNIIPAVSTSTGAYAGVFEWGPVLDPITVTSEEVLTQRFGHPNDNNFTSFFSAANFLSYSKDLLNVRVDVNGLRNAVSTPTGSVTNIIANAVGSGYTSVPTVTISAPQVVGGVNATGTAVLSGGSVTGVNISTKGSGYTSASVAFSAPQVVGGVTATGTAVLSGSVTGYTIDVPGIDYTSATITFPAPESVGGVTATATLDLSGGAVVGVVITNPGSGYLVAPVPVISGNGTTAVVSASITLSAIESVNIDIPGAGYITAPTVTFTGTGSNATATSVVSSSGISSYVITNPGSGYTATPTVTVSGGGGSSATATTAINVGGVKIRNTQDYLDHYSNGQGTTGEFAAKYPGKLGNSLTISVADSATYNSWLYKNNFNSAPGTSSYATSINSTNDELHIVIVDSSGAWTGTVGTVLEKYSYVSKAAGAKKSDGTNNYYKDVLNSQSKYVWWTDHPASGTNWGTSNLNTTFASLGAVLTKTLSGGLDDYAATDGNIQEAYALLVNQELYDISLLVSGKVSAATANYIISNVAETRRDLVAFVSPVDVNTNEIITGTGSDPVNKIIEFRNALPSSSYAFLDSGFKYQYDRYNDKYRWVPLNADIAGLAARTDYTNDAWWSIAGYNRGQIKNWIKLAVQLGRTERDNLYKNGVNPVIIEPGQGCILFGDKTLLAKPSAFDRINVRRLFIVLEKAISKAAKYQLFEFNDEFTRASFVNMVTPFLRDVQGRRGLSKFAVKCDTTNNTPQVIQSNGFVGDIFVSPNYSVNFIQLNFVATNNFAQFNISGV